MTGLGASAAIDYRSGDWVELVRAASGGGVDLVYDGIGNSTLPGSIKACRRGGRWVLYCYTPGGHRDGLATAFDTRMLAPRVGKLLNQCHASQPGEGSDVFPEQLTTDGIAEQ